MIAASVQRLEAMCEFFSIAVTGRMKADALKIKKF